MRLGLAALVLVVAGIGLRTFGLDLGWFGIDQGRDVATALDVARGLDAPTIGPTMRRVVRLGAGYYYFWAVPYVVWHEPLAAYWYAAGLSVAAMLLVAALASRLWGRGAAFVTLAFAATHPVWVIDGRVAWAPAALPAVGAVLLWLLLARGAVPWSAGRLALVGAVLGLAVQLHISMIAWVLALGLVVLLERPPLRAVLAGVGAGLLTGWPALLAIVAAPAGEGGVASLPGLSGLDVGARLAAMLTVGWRVPTALSQWPDAGLASMPLALGVGAMTMLALAGLGRLVRRPLASRPARLVLALMAAGGGLVLALPGEAWWYYLDGLLPVAALAAGAVLMPEPREPAVGWQRAAIAVAGAAGVVLIALLSQWLVQLDRHGYLAVDPRLLTLDARPGADAATPGRMPSVQWQRAFATHAAGGDAAAREERTRLAAGEALDDLWGRLHGPALGDLVSDNGFWVRWAAARGRPAPLHVAVWYADAPPVPGFASATPPTGVGPLQLVRYRSALDHATCRSADGPTAVPIRVVPHPKRYGDGRPERPDVLPPYVECELGTTPTPQLLVAALDGPGTVRLDVGGVAAPAGGASALCLPAAATPRAFRVEIEQPPGSAAALDVYSLPAARCP